MAFTVHAQQLTFTTFAGPVGGAGSADGTGIDARFAGPRGVATDSGGNLYVADTRNNTIRKITPVGVVTTVAGSAGLIGSEDGAGSAARFFGPQGVATDSRGNLYVADTRNDTVRKITPAGVVTTVAGSAGLVGSEDGTGNAARFREPMGVATDSEGNVYVADTDNHTIRKITPAGMVTTIAGSTGLSGNADGTSIAARFKNPFGVAVDTSGNVYVADTFNETIRKITQAGAVTTLAGSVGERGWTDGPGSAARFDTPAGVATDSAGNVYVADAFYQKIRKITPAGVVTTLVGSTGLNGVAYGNAGAPPGSAGVATDSARNVYVSDSFNNTIRKITPAGVVTTLAGSAAAPGSEDGTGSAARFDTPAGVAIDSAGNVYVADSGNNMIRKITPAGVVTTLAGSKPFGGSEDGTGSAARFHTPMGVATDSGGNVYVADSGNNTIRKINPAGSVTTLAGSVRHSGSEDETGNAARFNQPGGVATDKDGNVYVADTGNYTIRKITPVGAVTTLAGSAGNVGDADGISAPRFYGPQAAATDGDGNLYVADSGSTIRKITPAGIVTTLAGATGKIGGADGTGSAARFDTPTGVATDSDGNVYVADWVNNTIRKINPKGVVTTLAGSAAHSGSEDGTESAARFNGPRGVATDSSGNVYVADLINHKIRIGRPALADAATIDSSTGAVGTSRQLSTSTQTATSWQWTLIRMPSASAARLSSTSIRNPRFTPDVADLYVFQLTASKGEKTSITTVSLTATAPIKH